MGWQAAWWGRVLSSVSVLFFLIQCCFFVPCGGGRKQKGAWSHDHSTASHSNYSSEIISTVPTVCTNLANALMQSVCVYILFERVSPKWFFMKICWIQSIQINLIKLNSLYYIYYSMFYPHQDPHFVDICLANPVCQIRSGSNL